MEDEADKSGRDPSLHHPPSLPSPARGEGVRSSPSPTPSNSFPSPSTREGRGGGGPSHDVAEERPIFEALLYPHRSLSERGFKILIIGTLVIGGAYGALFLVLGAWPIFGFLGAEWLLLWWLFRTHFRGDRRAERIRLYPGRLLVQQIDAKGRAAEQSFEPYWLQIILTERGFENPALLLRSHGRAIEIGAFLGPAERRQFAGQLRAALQRWRAI